MLPTEFTVSELRQAIRDIYPDIGDVDLNNLILILRARVSLNRTLGN